VQGSRYRNLPISRYRVYCLERLREEFASLSNSAQANVRALLPYPQADVIWQETIPVQSGYDTAREAPFNKAINVFGTGVPQ
jgi:hypothetical protein